MMVLMLLILFLCGNVYADMFVVEKKDKGVVVVNYDPLYSDSLEDIVGQLGLTGQPIKRITKDDLPARSDRDFWRLNDVSIGKKIVVDETAKLKHQQEKEKKLKEKQDARKKICPQCSEDDFRKAFGD